MEEEELAALLWSMPTSLPARQHHCSAPLPPGKRDDHHRLFIAFSTLSSRSNAAMNSHTLDVRISITSPTPPPSGHRPVSSRTPSFSLPSSRRPSTPSSTPPPSSASASPSFSIHIPPSNPADDDATGRTNPGGSGAWKRFLDESTESSTTTGQGGGAHGRDEGRRGGRFCCL